jgi:hypothetical protein
MDGYLPVIGKMDGGTVTAGRPSRMVTPSRERTTKISDTARVTTNGSMEENTAVDLLTINDPAKANIHGLTVQHTLENSLKDYVMGLVHTQ